MNDEFLYRLRKEPPPEFAARLKARLDRQGPVNASRKRSLITFAAIALFLGGSVFAFVSPTVRITIFAFFIQAQAPKPQPEPVRAPAPAMPAPLKPARQESKPPPLTSWKWGDESHAAPVTPSAPPRRDHVVIVSSASSLAITTFVADRLGVRDRPGAPHIQSTGSGGGLKLFCKGSGYREADIAAVSRRITAAEANACAKNNAGPIVEIKVGYEAVVLARASGGSPLALTRRELYLALARAIPDPFNSNASVVNPYVRWRQINPALPDERIEVVGPAEAAPLRDVFMALILRAGCPFERNSDLCGALRTDGPYIEAAEKDEAVLRRVESHPGALGIFSYGFAQQNARRLTLSPIEGVLPAYETLANNSYTASRTLYVYLKKDHTALVPSLSRFTTAYIANEVIGPNGYVAAQGLVPLSDEERAKSRADALALRPLPPSALTGR